MNTEQTLSVMRSLTEARAEAQAEIRAASKRYVETASLEDLAEVEALADYIAELTADLEVQYDLVAGPTRSTYAGTDLRATAPAAVSLSGGTIGNTLPGLAEGERMRGFDPRVIR